MVTQSNARANGYQGWKVKRDDEHYSAVTIRHTPGKPQIRLKSRTPKPDPQVARVEPKALQRTG